MLDDVDMVRVVLMEEALWWDRPSLLGVASCLINVGNLAFARYEALEEEVEYAALSGTLRSVCVLSMYLLRCTK